MSHLISQDTAIQFALCSCQSVSAGNVTFSFLDGDFTPTISSSTVTLDAGYEYFIATSLTTSVTTAVSYYHIVDSINRDSYTIGSTSTSSGLDQLFDQVSASSNTSFSIYASDAITTNSRIEIWRHAL